MVKRGHRDQGKMSMSKSSAGQGRPRTHGRTSSTPDITDRANCLSLDGVPASDPNAITAPEEQTSLGQDTNSPSSGFAALDDDAATILHATLQECLRDVQVDVLLNRLKQIPPRGLSYVMKFLGLTKVARVNRGMASALLNRLRTRPNLDLLSFIFAPLFEVFDHSHLSNEQWARLLSGDWEHTVAVLQEDPAFAWHLVVGCEQVDERLYPVSLAIAALSSRAAAPALAFLSREISSAEEAYAGVRLKHMDLPPAQAAFRSITPDSLRRDAADQAALDRIEAALDAALNPHSDNSDGFEVPGEQPVGGTETPGDEAPSARSVPSADQGDLATQPSPAAAHPAGASSEGPAESVAVPEGLPSDAALGVAELDWELAAAASDRISAALQDRCAPQLHDVEHLREFAEQAYECAARLSEATGESVAASAEALAAAATRLLQDREHADLLQALADLEGPDELSSPIAAIRTLAQQILAGHGDDGIEQGLLALAELAQLGRDVRAGTSKEYGRIGQFEATARAHLPAATVALISAALLGDLHVGPISPPPDLHREDPGKASAMETSGGGIIADSASPSKTKVEPMPQLDAGLRAIDEVHATEDAGSRALQGEDADDVEGRAPIAGRTGAEIKGEDADGDSVDDEDLDLDALARFLESEDAGPARIRAAQGSAEADRNQLPSRNGRGDKVGQRTGDDGADLENNAAAEDQYGELQDAEAKLLREGRFGLASLLHRDPAHAAARRLAAYQAGLTASAGHVAAAFAADRALIGRGTLGDDRPGQLLAWAAAARVALLSPACGASEVLDDLAPCLASYPTLVEFGRELAAASRGGAIALPEHSEDLSAQHRASEAATASIATARELMDNAPRRSMKYVPATAVYQHLMAPEGEFGRLLSRVLANVPASGAVVQAEIVELRRNLDRLVDDTVPRAIRATKTRRIEAGARAALMQRLNEVLAVASEWADAAAASMELQERLRGAARAARPLDRLRAHLERVHDAAFDELDELRASSDDGTPAGRLEGAARAALASIVVSAFDICTGNPPQHPEQSPQWLVCGELLGTDLSLDAGSYASRAAPASTIDPEGDETVLHAAVCELAARDALAPDRVYELRAARADHDLTGVLVENLACTSPDAAAVLLAERDSATAELRPAVASEVAAIADVVNVARRDETIPENVWSTLLARLEPLSRPGRMDFGKIRAELVEVRSIVDSHTGAAIDAARIRVQERAKDNALVAENRDRLLSLLDQGDLVGAEEFLEQLMSGEALPEAHREDDMHLGRFFPAIPDLFEQYPRLLEDLQASLGNVDVVPASPLRELFAAAGVGPKAALPAGRPVGRQAIGAWLHLAGQPKRQSVDVGTLLKAILAVMGLEFRGDATLDKGDLRGRRFVTLREVDGIGKALVPALGSQMSGRGSGAAHALSTLRVLLVNEPASPTTLMSWLTKEPEDQTVLVLYTAGSLSADQRRALASASRGRPRPVAVVVDASALAYMAVQSEPSRETLAAITVPFTAASPYRDTPGDTPREMFYGRVDELRAVLDLASRSFVSGGRQLGKSALLRTAMRSFDNGTSRRSLLIDVRQVGAIDGPEELWPMLNAELRTSGIGSDDSGNLATADSVTEVIRNWLNRDADRQLLILIDEADNFLTTDADSSRFSNVHACKRLMERERGRVKFVFAGLHRTSRFESLPNQPLAHMGKPIVVGPLRAQAAQDLITRPMNALGFTFADAPTQTARILAATNSVPSLIQLFGEALIEHMTSRDIGDGPPQQITNDDIAAVLTNRSLTERFREKYILTLNLDHRYQVIVHVVAQAAYENGVDDGLRLRDLVDQCRQFWPAGFAGLPIDHLRALVTECCDLGLLTEEAGRYRMRTPYVLRLLGTLDEVADLLYNADERLSLPSTLDASSYRETYGSDAKRSPLAAQQVGGLFANMGVTRIVVGTEALAAGRVIPYLESFATKGRGRGLVTQRLANVTAVSLVSHAARITRPTMLALDMRQSSPAQLAALLEATPVAHQAATADLVVTILTGLAASPAWVSAAQMLVGLRRVDRPGLRMWCEEADPTFDEPGILDALLGVTGGWPYLIDRVIRRPESGGPAAARQRLAQLTDWLDEPANAALFVGACGLGNDDESAVTTALRAVYSAVIDLTGGDAASLEDVVALLGGDVESPLHDKLRAAEFDGVAEALNALMLVGILTTHGSTTAGLNISIEPVLAAAMARVDEHVEQRQ